MPRRGRNALGRVAEAAGGPGAGRGGPPAGRVRGQRSCASNLADFGTVRGGRASARRRSTFAAKGTRSSSPEVRHEPWLEVTAHVYDQALIAEVDGIRAQTHTYIPPNTVPAVDLPRPHAALDRGPSWADRRVFINRTHDTGLHREAALSLAQHLHVRRRPDFAGPRPLCAWTF